MRGAKPAGQQLMKPNHNPLGNLLGGICFMKYSLVMNRKAYRFATITFALQND